MVSAAKNTVWEPHVSLNEAGALANKRQERMAILMAEGFGPNETLKAEGAGETPTQGRRKYGARIFTDKVFMARVEVLKTQKDAMEADPIWGEAMWMVAQLWRSAMLTGDIKTMGEAAKMRMQIADKRVDPSTAAEAPAEEAEKRTPGKPAAEGKQTRVDPAGIKASLMSMGRGGLPTGDDDDEVTEH